jgi:lipopolysaccharide export system permease protein
VKTIDRYIIKQFLLNYLLLFAALMLLIITLDLIVNLDEFTQVTDRMAESATGGEKFRAVIWAIVDFYGPQVFLFYVYAAGVLPIAAAGFTFAALMRSRELTAMLAGGISLYRVAVPVLVMGCMMSGLVLIDQELVIPALKEKLSRTHKHVKYGDVWPFAIEFVPDVADADGDGVPERDLLFFSNEYNNGTQTMDRPTILRRDLQGRAVEKITAAEAEWDSDRGGWELIDGYSVQQSATDPSASRQLDPKPIQFIKSDLDPTTLMMHRNSRMRQLLSLRELSDLMSRGNKIVPREELDRIRHGRFSLMVINVLILAMGLPFFLVRRPVNLLTASVKAAPLCLGAWAGSFIMMQVGGGDIPPALGAWLPTVMYLPVALFMLDRIET